MPQTHTFREFYKDETGEDWDDLSLDKNKLSTRFKAIADFLDLDCDFQPTLIVKPPLTAEELTKILSPRHPPAASSPPADDLATKWHGLHW